MAYEKKVKITKDGQEAEVLSSSLAVYERLGWTAADDGSSGETESESAPEPQEKAPAKKTTTRKAAE